MHSSNPVFTIEQSGFLAYFRKLSVDPSHKIALLGDSEELGISHQYIELIGRQHGVNVQSFRDEASAVKWFNADDVAVGGAVSPSGVVNRSGIRRSDDSG